MGNLKNKPTKLPDDKWLKRSLTKWRIEKSEQEPKCRVYKTPTEQKVVPYSLHNKNDEEILRVHYIADPDLITRLLSDEGSRVSLAHYDQALSSLTQPISLLLGENQRQPTSWEILAKALSLETGDPRDHLLHGVMERQNPNAIEELALRKSREVLNQLYLGQKFNIIRDYGYLVPYLVGKEFCGLQDVKSTPVLVRTFAIVRNIFLCSHGRARLRFWDKNKSANTYLLWTATMFGQIFGNPGNLNPFIRMAASWGAASYCKIIQSSMKNLDSLPAYTLLKRLDKVKENDLNKTKVTSDEYQELSTFLVLEVMTSFHILIGLAFANMMEELSKQDGGLKMFIARLKTAHEKDNENKSTVETDKIINQVLSKNSNTDRLYRIAKVPILEHGIKAGDTICLLVAEASKHVTTPENSLNFGPHEACPYHLSGTGQREYSKNAREVSHPCFGQFWARAVIKAMFLSLDEKFPNAKPLKKEVKKLGIPEILMYSTGGK